MRPNQLLPRRNRERIINLIVLVKFLLRFNSNNDFQLFPEVLLNLGP